MGTESREYQKVISYLCGLVKTKELSAGSKLPTERKLAQTLAIGRNSTREALRVLEHMGVIECRQGSGNYFVGDMSKTISEVIEMMLLLRQVTREEIIAFRRDMEKAVCNQIIARDSIGRWGEKIEHILEAEMESRMLEEQIEADRSFHYMLISATENQLWICISESIVRIYQNWIECVLESADPELKCRLSQCHKKMLWALKKGSKEEVEKAIDAHYDLVHSRLKEREEQCNGKTCDFMEA